MTKFTSLLKEARLQKKLTKVKTAQLLGWTPMYYGRYENGYLKPTDRNIQIFADFIGISQKELREILSEDE